MLCFGGTTGTATAVPAGGTAPYTYSWNSVPVQTTVTATNLGAGTYTVTVTDASGCTTTATATVTQPAAALTATATATNVLCFGNTTGTATALPVGGTAPYTYSWNTVPVAPPLQSTLVCVKVAVIEAAGCVTVAVAVVVHPLASVTVTV